MTKIVRAPRRVLGRLKEVSVTWETFDFMTYCVVGPHEDLDKYVRWRHHRKYNIPAKRDTDGLHFNSIPSKGSIIWLPRMPRKAKDIGTLAHEISHAVLDMVATRNIAVSTKYQEPFCYAISHGVETILMELRK